MKMSLKDMTGWILMAAALGLGCIAFLMISSYLDSREAQLRKAMIGEKRETVSVVVATRPLQAGQLVNGSNMAVGELPRRHVSPRMVTPGDFKRVQQHVLVRPMVPGEPLFTDFLAGVVAQRFSDLLQPGERAVSLEAKSLDNIAGMLLPGDYVDLFTLIKGKGSVQAPRLVAVLSRVKVLAAGQQPLRNSEQAYQNLSDRDVDNYNQITVGVSLAQAERLILAKEAGRIVYLLRNAIDDLPGTPPTEDFFSQGAKGLLAGDGYIYHSIGKGQGEFKLIPKTASTPKQATLLANTEPEPILLSTQGGEK